MVDKKAEPITLTELLRDTAKSFMHKDEVIAHNAEEDRVVFIERAGGGYPSYVLHTVLTMFNADLTVLERRYSTICITPKLVPVMIKALQELQGSGMYADMLSEQVKIDKETTEAIKQELATEGEQDGKKD